MRILLAGFSTLVGFVFTVGGSGNTSAQESRTANMGTMVIARQGASMTQDWYDGQRSRLLTVLAASKDNDDNKDNKGKGKGDTKGKTKKDTKPTKKNKSPSK